MQTCTECGESLPWERFHRNKRMPTGYVKQCKTCARGKYATSVRDRAHRDRLYLQAIKMERGCADCGYNAHAAALDFDHLPGTEKRYRLATMYGMKRELIDAEIAKCEVVCANCHRIRTAERRPPLSVLVTANYPLRRKAAATT